MSKFKSGDIVKRLKGNHTLQQNVNYTVEKTYLDSVVLKEFPSMLFDASFTIHWDDNK